MRNGITYCLVYCIDRKLGTRWRSRCIGLIVRANPCINTAHYKVCSLIDKLENIALEYLIGWYRFLNSCAIELHTFHLACDAETLRFLSKKHQRSIGDSVVAVYEIKVFQNGFCWQPCWQNKVAMLSCNGNKLFYFLFIYVAQIGQRTYRSIPRKQSQILFFFKETYECSIHGSTQFIISIKRLANHILFHFMNESLFFRMTFVT